MIDLDYNDFLLVFKKTETMPQNKTDLMLKLFTFYKAGIKNENERIKNNLINLLTKNI